MVIRLFLMNFETGVYTVIPTFFSDREIDMESIFKIINYQLVWNLIPKACTLLSLP